MNRPSDHPQVSLDAIQRSLAQDGRASVEDARQTFQATRAVAMLQRDFYQALVDDLDVILQRIALVLDQGGEA